jgi:hypothetical protein
MLVVQLSDQPRSVHEVHGSIPNIMKFCHIVLCLYIHKMNRAVITNKLYVLSMSSNNTNHFVNRGIPESQTIGFIFGPKSIVTRYTQFLKILPRDQIFASRNAVELMYLFRWKLRIS